MAKKVKATKTKVLIHKGNVTKPKVAKKAKVDEVALLAAFEQKYNALNRNFSVGDIVMVPSYNFAKHRDEPRKAIILKKPSFLSRFLSRYPSTEYKVAVTTDNRGVVVTSVDATDIISLA